MHALAFLFFCKKDEVEEKLAFIRDKLTSLQCAQGKKQVPKIENRLRVLDEVFSLMGKAFFSQLNAKNYAKRIMNICKNSTTETVIKYFCYGTMRDFNLTEVPPDRRESYLRDRNKTNHCLMHLIDADSFIDELFYELKQDSKTIKNDLIIKVVSGYLTDELFSKIQISNHAQQNFKEEKSDQTSPDEKGKTISKFCEMLLNCDFDIEFSDTRILIQCANKCISEKIKQYDQMGLKMLREIVLMVKQGCDKSSVRKKVAKTISKVEKNFLECAYSVVGEKGMEQYFKDAPFIMRCLLDANEGGYAEHPYGDNCEENDNKCDRHGAAIGRITEQLSSVASFMAGKVSQTRFRSPYHCDCPSCGFLRDFAIENIYFDKETFSRIDIGQYWRKNTGKFFSVIDDAIRYNITLNEGDGNVIHASLDGEVITLTRVKAIKN
jgi:hypothetical protein